MTAAQLISARAADNENLSVYEQALADPVASFADTLRGHADFIEALQTEINEPPSIALKEGIVRVTATITAMRELLGIPKELLIKRHLRGPVK